ncbi:MAG: homocysteine S-methyltransferase family protein [Candidatus Omnitrophota bacterium]
MNITKLVKNKIVILDGATGTELYKRGMPVGVCPESWCMDNPDILAGVHADYVKSGSDIVYTSTFGANRLKLKQYGINDVIGTNEKLARIAVRAVKGKAFVAGELGPTGKFFFPFGTIPFEEAVIVFKEQVKGLLSGGVDLFIIETMMDLQEARAAVLAVKELTDKPVFVTMTFDENLRTLNGNDPLSCLVTLENLGVCAFGCNCSLGPKEMIKIVRKIKPYANVPIITKANAGLPKFKDDTTFYDMDAQEFAGVYKELVNEGANIVGGCCGTTPEFISELVKTVTDVKPVLPVKNIQTMLCSSRKTVFLDRTRFFTIGEKINPTGKKKFQQLLREKNYHVIREMADEQIRNGADLLDVNVGASGVDEKEALRNAVGLLSEHFDIPLVIDTSDMTALEEALRIYPGRALVNSVSAETIKLERALPLVAKYGAAFILLPLDDKTIPGDFAGRRKNIQKILKKSDRLGIDRSAVIVDGLLLSVSSNPEVVNEVLATFKWVSGTLGLNTTCGLSNISHGLPERAFINVAFLKLAQENGLSTAIIDPLIVNMPIKKYAMDLLCGKDKDAREYVRIATNDTIDVCDIANLEVVVQASPEEKVYQAVLNGERESILTVIDNALSAGIKPDVLLDDFMIKAINDVGVKFEAKKLFLPQLLASAETMKIGVARVKPLLVQESTGRNEKVILATVQGDIHDIGKNIVALMIENQGIEVIDLGNDVAPEKIIEAAKKYKPKAIGLSALMTTTMSKMHEVINLARDNGIKCPFIVGGAVLTEEYATSIGAYYSKDGVATVKLLERLK